MPEDNELTNVSVAAHEPPSLLPPNFYDVREEAEELAKRDARIRKKVGPNRSWEKVTGICLHQTAVVLGRRPGRWASLGAHVGITLKNPSPANGEDPRPRVIWVHDFSKTVYHGNRWNSGTVGIEIDGGYAGVEGDINTFWRGGPLKKPLELSDELVESAQKTIRWIHDYLTARGCEVRALVAHRQSSKHRRSDPGEAIWKRIALPMQEELGLGDGGQGFELGGYPIPEAWNPAYVGEKY